MVAAKTAVNSTHAIAAAYPMWFHERVIVDVVADRRGRPGRAAWSSLTALVQIRPLQPPIRLIRENEKSRRTDHGPCDRPKLSATGFAPSDVRRFIQTRVTRPCNAARNRNPCCSPHDRPKRHKHQRRLRPMVTELEPFVPLDPKTA